jgi:DNA-binding NtrC family response regulator
MQYFIAKSDISKKILKSARMSADLPINILIYGNEGVGKNLLAKEILPNTLMISATKLEYLIYNDQINLNEYKAIIIIHIDKIKNFNQFVNHFNNIKIVATSYRKLEHFNTHFALNIHIPNLDKREQDLKYLIQYYKQEAYKIFDIKLNEKDLIIDLSKNGKSLKKSIFKSVLLQSYTKEDVLLYLRKYFDIQLQQGQNYNTLLEIFEIPLLQAAKKIFHSQVQISKHLGISRITLRKKLFKYGL